MRIPEGDLQDPSAPRFRECDDLQLRDLYRKIRILPKYGISFIKIDRITTEGPDGKPEVISASRVRKLLDEQGVTDEVLSLVPECTAEYLKESFK